MELLDKAFKIKIINSFRIYKAKTSQEKFEHEKGKEILKVHCEEYILHICEEKLVNLKIVLRNSGWRRDRQTHTMCIATLRVWGNILTQFYM